MRKCEGLLRWGLAVALGFGLLASPARAQFAEELYRLAEFRQLLQDYTGAIGLCDQAIARQATYADAYYLRASCKLAIGDALGAQQDFDRLLRFARKKAKAYAGRSSAHSTLGNYTQAIADAQRALSEDSTNTLAQQVMASALAGQKFYTQAIGWCDRVLARDSLSHSARLTRGDCYAALGEFDRARRDYTRVVSARPTTGNELEANGQALTRLGRLSEARQAYTAALARSEQLVDARLGRAVLCLQLDSAQAALDDLNILLRLNPRHLMALVVRGDAYRQIHSTQAAFDDYQRALSLDPTYAFAYFARANAYFDQGDFSAALADYNDAIARNDDDFAAYNNRGNLYSRRRQYKQAMADYRRSAELNPTDPDLRYNMALALYHLGERDSARRQLGYALAANPRHWLSMTMLAEMAFEDQDFTLALEWAARLPDANRNSTNILLLRGQALEQLCRYAEAEAAYQRTLALDPDRLEAWEGLGNVHFERRSDSLAVHAYDQVLLRQPQRISVYWNLIQALKRLRHYELALQRCTEALTYAPLSSHVLAERGLLHFGLQQFDRACDDWQRAARQGDERAQGYLSQHCR